MTKEPARQIGRPTEWDRFPVEAIGWPTFVKRAVIHADLVLNALLVSRPGGRILEVGVGSGAQSALLSRWRRVVTVERDQRILEACQPNLRRFGLDVRCVHGDGFELPFVAGSFDVAVSQGLMEHFPDTDVAALVREQLRVSRSIVFSVPSHNYPRQDVGDERLMSPREWRSVLEEAVPGPRYEVRTRHPRLDLEACKYSVAARRWLGSFAVIAQITGP